MKVTIQGVRYDTDKSTLLLNKQQDGWEAGLYMTPRSGQYFLAGSGGPMTIFRGRSRIIPLTPKEAKAFI